jgi:hypothetical protein
MRIVILLALLSLTVSRSVAQCVPDTFITHNDPGVYPDTITNLPHAHENQPYATTIQLKVKADTFYLAQTITIDSINILSVTGFPTGFQYSCTPSNCSFPGGSDACLYLTGTAPTAGMIGTYPITVNVKAYAHPSGIPLSLSSTITGYNIVIDTTTGISGVNAYTFSVGQNSPNPAKDNTVLPVNLVHSADVNVKITNLIGKKVFDRSFDLNRGLNNVNLDLHGLPPGIYLYSVTEGKSTITRRMIVSND